MSRAATKARKMKVRYAPEQDNGPTPERAARPDYEDALDGKRIYRRAAAPVESLVKAGLIEAQHKRALERWYRDYILSSHGYFEAQRERDAFIRTERDEERLTERDAEKMQGYVHDSITWALQRGKASCRLSVVRDKLRPPGERILMYLAVERISFEEIGRRECPTAGDGYNAARGVKSRCAQILVLL